MLDSIIRDVTNDVFLMFYKSFAGFQRRRTIIEAIVQAECSDAKGICYDVEVFVGHYKTPSKNLTKIKEEDVYADRKIEC